MNPEFSQRPFAVGSLMGVRSFRVTPEGVLTGVMQQEPWTAGVNEAVCRRSSIRGFAAAMASMAVSGANLAESMWSLTDTMCRVTGSVNLRKRPKPPPPPPAPPEPAPHQAGTLDCTCGFYAYFDEGNNPHHGYGLGTVLGVVEGFGVCTTGTRGFRSSKARLRALIADNPFPAYPDVPIFPTLAAALAEFPLTPVEGAVKPAGRVTVASGTMTYTFRPDTRDFDRAVQSLLRAYQPKPQPPLDETRRERALRLRRERNTGPADVRGLDGRRRA